MVTEIIRKVFNINSERINRDGDLKPTGVKYTIRGDYGFNETFEHIFRERLKS
jgi:hypothetical protein